MDGSSAQRALARPHLPAAWLTSGHEAQVFVDDSGRRALAVRLVGCAAAALCAFWLTGLVIGMVGFSGFASGGLSTLAQRSALLRAHEPLVADVGERRDVSAARQGAGTVRAPHFQTISAQRACATYRAGARTSGRRRTALRSACLIELAAADQRRDVASA